MNGKLDLSLKFKRDFMKFKLVFFPSGIKEVTEKMISLVTEKGLNQLEAWNRTSQQLLNVARV